MKKNEKKMMNKMYGYFQMMQASRFSTAPPLMPLSEDFNDDKDDEDGTSYIDDEYLCFCFWGFFCFDYLNILYVDFIFFY